MAIIPFHIVDAFAEHPFTGNPAAIIPNAAGLSELEMLQITDELSMEAGFVLPPDTATADVRLRFFTKRREALLSGHVVIAAFASMADRGFYKATPEGNRLTVQTGAGELPVTLTTDGAGRARVTLGLPTPRFGEPVPTMEVATALDLPPTALGLGDHGPARVSCGFDQVIVPVNDREAIRGVFRDMESIGEFTDQRGVGGVTLVCPETVDPGADVHCRFFHPRIGVGEDVASGTSLGAAAAWLVDRGLVPGNGVYRVVSEQGHALGRPTCAEMTVYKERDAVTAVELTATGAVVMRGSFHFNRRAATARG
ncbi:MAG: PhzF family phenazine biosynthesis protein [bacterium]|nr:PhzF family phenazine biosynthesis protein [bacterium]